MSDTELKLRKLMNLYDERYGKLKEGEREAKESNDYEAEIISEALQQQCRIMIAELFHTMKAIGVLDEEEIKWGSIKNIEL